MTITGTISFQNIGTGFWGITDRKGNQYRPVNMPAVLQQNGLSVIIKAKEVAEGASMFMWGTPIRIISIEQS